MNNWNVRDLCLNVLVRVEQKQSYSNLELNRAFQRSSLSHLDKKLATEIVYGTISRRNTLDYVLTFFVRKGLHKLDAWVRELLRMSVYQLVYLSSVPAHAVVHEAVEIAKRRGHRGHFSFVNAVLRSVLRQRERWDIPENIGREKRMALRHSHPEWLVRRWLSVWDEGTVSAICEANNTPPRHAIRVNPLKTSPEKLKTRIEKEIPHARVFYSDVSPDGLIVESAGNVADRIWYKDGLCTIQDESAMLVSYAVNPEPGANVLDMCAAPGGKATHMAELMGGRGVVEAYDLYEHRVQLIAKQAKRLNLPNVLPKQGDGRDLPERTDATFDYVLLDAPCSGFGVIRRKPEIKWRRTVKAVDQLVQLQAELLRSAARLVKPGGVLVYSTCTLESQENEEQIFRFLAEHPNYRLDEKLKDILPEGVVQKASIGRGMVRILPQYFHSDGFFISRLRRLET